jgi:hypothetical protein
MDSPEAPDPYATAAAQSQSNKETAITQQKLNMTDQITPYGNLTYTQTGTYEDGTPKFQANTTLSPELQKLVGGNIANAQGMSDTQGKLLGNVSDRLSQPLNLGWSETEARLNQLGRNTIDPQYEQQGAQLEQKLRNQGVTQGSEAYNNAMRSFGDQKAAAYNNLYLTGHNTATNDLMSEYNQPLNSLNALRSGTQVSQPGINQAQTPQTGVQGTNIAGLIQDNYKTQAAQSQAQMGGLFGLGGTALSALAMMCDRRLKTNIQRLGTGKHGLPTYTFNYIWGGPQHLGHMADEVEKVAPQAVFEVGGFKAVDYSRI